MEELHLQEKSKVENVFRFMRLRPIEDYKYYDEKNIYLYARPKDYIFHKTSFPFLRIIADLQITSSRQLSFILDDEFIRDDTDLFVFVMNDCIDIKADIKSKRVQKHLTRFKDYLSTSHNDFICTCIYGLKYMSKTNLFNYVQTNKYETNIIPILLHFQRITH